MYKPAFTATLTNTFLWLTGWTSTIQTLCYWISCCRAWVVLMFVRSCVKQALYRLLCSLPGCGDTASSFVCCHCLRKPLAVSTHAICWWRQSMETAERLVTAP